MLTNLRELLQSAGKDENVRSHIRISAVNVEVEPTHVRDIEVNLVRKIQWHREDRVEAAERV